MKGDPQAASARLPVSAAGWRWSSWITELRSRRRRAWEEQIVLIEALEREERGRRRAGEYIPDVRSARRWS